MSEYKDRDMLRSLGKMHTDFEQIEEDLPLPKKIQDRMRNAEKDYPVPGEENEGENEPGEQNPGSESSGERESPPTETEDRKRESKLTRKMREVLESERPDIPDEPGAAAFNGELPGDQGDEGE